MDERNDVDAEADERMPVVMIDDTPPRRSRFVWPALGGVLLLAVLAGAMVVRARRPASPPPAPAVEIAFVDPAPEPVAYPDEPAVQEIPEPPVPPPSPSLVKTEAVVAKAVEEPPAVPEPPADPPTPPPPPAVPAKAPPLPSPAPAPAPAPEAPTIENRFLSAAALLRDAEPLFREIADQFDPAALKKADVRELASKMDRVELQLEEAQQVYIRLRADAPDLENLEWRIHALEELQEAVKTGRARIKVPLAMKNARALENEVAPLSKEALDGFQPFSREAHALDAKAEMTVRKLREARKLYASIRNEAPDPKTIDGRIRRIDAVVDSLESRFPSIQQSAR